MSKSVSLAALLLVALAAPALAQNKARNYGIGHARDARRDRRLGHRRAPRRRTARLPATAR